eukprot:TRINITY_DN4112_c0_g1_i13.p2 TRINITY_DN4112_c0_g1~~TRINITY_DN4112_c0_g1_i13.p2  ORF type:complete len:322 (+),score=51.71 TRINITY_DN4112_c0_g1_i13:138-1103(+)
MFFVLACIVFLGATPTLQQEGHTDHDHWFGFETVAHAPKCQTQGEDYCQLANLYVRTVMKSVTGILLRTPDYSFEHKPESFNRQRSFNEQSRKYGLGRPVYGLTMVGWVRLVNIHQQLLRVMNEGIEGDFLEAGVWRGGSSIVAKSVISAFEGKDRKVHVVDSFQGLPAPRKHFENKDTDGYSKLDYIRVSQEHVQANFQRYGLLDEQVQFHKGFFNVSLSQFRKDNPSAKIAFLRLDGDMYESTTDILYNVYDFVPVGGTVVVDDWGLKTARDAFMDFFQHHGVELEKMTKIDTTAAYMIKSKEVAVDYQYYLDNFVGNI